MGIPIEDDEKEAASSGEGFAGRSETGDHGESQEEIVRGAPLLVEFRRLILQDVMDRFGEAKGEAVNSSWRNHCLTERRNARGDVPKP
ncbi:hypothetical protein TcBrA4_0052310 [Trypanosoma cruzi]|nr:hypothetical protein TcBrA4_0052310 [Trypanosoma cruzi]